MGSLWKGRCRSTSKRSPRRRSVSTATSLSRTADEVLGCSGRSCTTGSATSSGLDGYAYDEIEAASRVGRARAFPTCGRGSTPSTVRGEDRFLSVVLSAKRIANIVKDAPEDELDPGAPGRAGRDDLFEAFAELRAEIVERSPGITSGAPRIADLAPVLDSFFVDVLVMDPTEFGQPDRPPPGAPPDDLAHRQV